jgi:uncharacterized protein YbaA (DUF1428 family)
MTYFEAFVIPVPNAKKEEFRSHGAQFAALARELGVARQVETWADEVPHGTLTDFYRAVDAADGETVALSWFEYPSKSARDEANRRFREDPRMQSLGESAPFDGKRMILGGFEAIVETGEAPGKYVGGFIAPVPRDKKETYREMTEAQAAIFREHGALRLVQAWGDDVPEGSITDFRRAVKAGPDETIVIALIEWPSKAANDEAWDRIMKDERMQPSGEIPVDGKRLFWGGFDVILDSASEEQLALSATPLTA